MSRQPGDDCTSTVLTVVNNASLDVQVLAENSRPARTRVDGGVKNTPRPAAVPNTTRPAVVLNNPRPAAVPNTPRLAAVQNVCLVFATGRGPSLAEGAG